LVGDDIIKRNFFHLLLQKKYPDIKIHSSLITNTERNVRNSLHLAVSDWLILCKCQYIIFFSGSSFGYEAYITNQNRPVIEIPINMLLKNHKLIY